MYPECMAKKVTGYVLVMAYSIAVLPPSVVTSVPTTKEESEEARKSETFATSSGRPIRLSGTWLANVLWSSSTITCSLQNRRLDRPGVDRVDTDAAPDEFSRERARQGVERRFAGRIHGVASHPHQSGDRASENNRNLVVQQGQRLLKSEIGALKVGIHHLIKGRFICLGKRLAASDACIDKQDVQVAKGFPRTCHQEGGPGYVQKSLTAHFCSKICLENTRKEVAKGVFTTISCPSLHPFLPL